MSETKGTNLSVLLSLLAQTAAYQQLLSALGKDGRGATILEAAKPFLLAALHRDLKAPLLVVTARPEGAKRLYEQLLAWEASSVFFFAEPDALPYERLTPDFTTTQERLTALGALASPLAGSGPPLIVAPAWAVAQKTIPVSEFRKASHNLSPGTTVDLAQLLARWEQMGYRMESAVEVPGSASRRGGILDIFPAGTDKPVRIELLGNRIDSLRFFDPATQRSQQPATLVQVLPAREMLVARADGVAVREALTSLRVEALPAEARDRLQEEIERLFQGQWFPTLGFYGPLFNPDTILDYLPAASVLVWDEPADVQAALAELDERASELRRQREASGDLPSGFPIPYFTYPQLQEKSRSQRRQVELFRWEEVQLVGDVVPGAGEDAKAKGEAMHFPFSAAPAYGGQWASFVKSIKESLQQKLAIVIVSQQAPRLSEILSQADIIAPPTSTLKGPPPPGVLSLVAARGGHGGAPAEGWVIETGTRHAVSLLTDAEIFSFVKQQRWLKRHPVRRQPFMSELTPGEYAVHVDHGIGRFAGMVRMGGEGGEKEYLVLEYAEGDKLYVPTDQIDRVGRYIGPGGAVPPLSRLGTQDWLRTRQRVKQAAKDMARDLLDLYASREVESGFAFSPDSPWQQELEASFPYVETPDQMEAVQEVKEDMEKPRPMDRLVCGDVGYGKTEVALRAAFKAVMDGRQVAMLVPTTVLAQQHFNTFRQRLAAFPIKVEMLSRFRSAKEQQEAVAALKEGKVDICIGTHRMLQKDVSFKNLGLVIIDEEQRFGVAHKERLKQMRKEVDVLTLSATPIPRTLHMSLVGVRDMSTMETPPEERLPIKTYIAEYDDRLIRETILREMERNGQVFFVHNRVQTIGRIAQRLQELLPEARISVGHGQMPEEELERVMADFAQGRSDVLICSTIIESGLDIPNANTLIINDADRFGLTQLYQLRGRVGRGPHRAYAYFLYPKGKMLTETAQKRLETIYEATELGAGFKIAMKDLEIRGAGNLLGSEQSGHIGAVGFDLYCQMLSEAVEELKTRARGEIPRPTSHLPPPSIDLPLPAHIPTDYIEDVSSRLALYQRLSKVNTPEEIGEIAREMADRFGKPPPEVDDLLYAVKVKTLAMPAGLASIAGENGQIVLKLREGLKVERTKLGYLQGFVTIGATQIRLDRQRLGKRWREILEKVVEALSRALAAA